MQKTIVNRKNCHACDVLIKQWLLEVLDQEGQASADDVHERFTFRTDARRIGKLIAELIREKKMEIDFYAPSKREECHYRTIAFLKTPRKQA